MTDPQTPSRALLRQLLRPTRLRAVWRSVGRLLSGRGKYLARLRKCERKIKRRNSNNATRIIYLRLTY